MKITTKNYFKAIKEVGFENLPEVLKKSHLVIMTKTDEGKDWSIYDNDADVKRVFDLAFEKLDEFIDNKGDLSGTPEHPMIIRAKEDAEGYKHLPLDKLKMIYRLECAVEQEDGLTPEIKIRKPALEKAIAEKEGKNTTEKQESTLAMKFVKRFLLLSSKTHQKKEIEGFLNDVQDAIKEKEIVKDDALSKEVLLVQNKLLSLVNSMGKSIKVELSPATKKQFQLALNKQKGKKPSKKGLNGIETEEEIKPKQNLMSSIEFANLHFNSIGFTGKWLDLIGDPSPGFTAMVFGKPKMGKSYLCVDFAGYLARNHGTVLYVANEEKLDATLQMKLNDKDVKHENLFVSDYLPEDLSKYQFIILDSVNKLGLNPKDLDNLKRKNPGKSFIFIFQTTKDGNFKGANSYQHDVDVVIEIPEKGKATQFGRFNAGGEMNIFEDSSELSGVKSEEMEIEAEFPVPLGEIFIYLKRKGEKEEDIVDILENEPERGNAEMKKIANSIIRKKNLKIKVLEVEHSYNDSSNITHGVAYFKIKLSGAKKDLKRIAGENKEIEYDWDRGLDGAKKNSKVSNEKPMLIKPTFSVALEEFNFLIERSESVQEAIRANKLEAEMWVKKLAEAEIKKAQAKAKVENVYFMSNDDEADDEAEGLSYYDLRISGLENELRKVAGKDKDLYCVWPEEEDVSGTKKNSSSKSAKKSNVKKKTQKDWTEPEWLNKADWSNLKIIKKYCDQGKYKEAMSHAMDCDTVIRDEVPGDLWKKMGGTLTPHGEEKLKAAQGKSFPKVAEKKKTIVFNSTVRALKGVIEREWDIELTDGEYIEILDIAQERSVNFYEVVTDIDPNLTAFMTQIGYVFSLPE